LFPEIGSSPAATPPTKPTKEREGFGTIDAACEAYRRVRGKHGKPLGEWSAAWDYRDADGQVIGRVLRWDLPGATAKPDKEYRPVFLIGGAWRQSAPSPCPLTMSSKQASMMSSGCSAPKSSPNAGPDQEMAPVWASKAF
jgi:hypothetical protein